MRYMDWEQVHKVAAWNVEDDKPGKPFTAGWDREGREQVVRYEILGEHIRSTDTVFEVGCGYGAGVDILAVPPGKYTGIDLVPALVEVARKRHPKHRFEIGAVKWRTFKADVVFGIGVVNYKGGLSEDEARENWLDWMEGAWLSTNKLMAFNFTSMEESPFSSHVRFDPETLKTLFRSWPDVRRVRTIEDYSGNDFTVLVNRENC